MDATASSVAASTGRGRGAAGALAVAGGGAAGVAAISPGRGVPRRLRAAMALTWSWVCSGPRGRYTPLLLVLAVVVIRMMLLYHYRRPLAAPAGPQKASLSGDQADRIAWLHTSDANYALQSLQARLHDSPAETWPRKAPTASSCWRGQNSKSALQNRPAIAPPHRPVQDSYRCAVLGRLFAVPRPAAALA